MNRRGFFGLLLAGLASGLSALKAKPKLNETIVINWHDRIFYTDKKILVLESSRSAGKTGGAVELKKRIRTRVWQGYQKNLEWNTRFREIDQGWDDRSQNNAMAPLP